MKRLLFSFLILLSAFIVDAEDFAKAEVKNIALMPEQNAYRNVLDISGIWNFLADTSAVGESQHWQNGLHGSQPIAVPGSWNDQIQGLHNYLGRVWYETTVCIPRSWKGERVFLRVGSANYSAKIWINGKPLGIHDGGHVPFAFEINSLVSWDKPNRITIEMDNILRPDRVPLGGVKAAMRNFPATNYDFFPFGGLHRRVLLYTVPKASSLTDVTIATTFHASEGKINVKVEKTGNANGCRISVTDEDGKTISKSARLSDNTGNVDVNIPGVHLWSPENPYLYRVRVELIDDGKTVDEYACNSGVRTIAVNDHELLLNGKPIKLRGFGKHEGFPIFGRAFAAPVAVKDFELMKWTGANSFRTSHYPYDESVYDMADRLGFLVIDEMPSVGLYFYDEQKNIDARKAQCDQYLNEMITRDKNHPSVIIWSVANEPSYKGMGGANYNGQEQKGEDRENSIAMSFLGDLMRQARKKDPTRLATFVGVSGGPSAWYKDCDIICLNRYYGWYTNPGDMPGAIKILSGEMDKIHAQFAKPIVMTEFGADAIAGNHSEYDAMFSEEFQCRFIKDYLDFANTKNYMAGMMVWNFADFTTGQAMFRVGAKNLKGVFTQDRRPKMAAHYLHERWTKSTDF